MTVTLYPYLELDEMASCYGDAVSGGSEVELVEFRNIDGEISTISDCIISYIFGGCPMEILQERKEFLISKGCSEVDVNTFLGSYYDPSTGRLWSGYHYTLRDGSGLENPYFTDIPDDVRSSGATLGNWWEIGIAKGFVDPPYSIRAKNRNAIQDAFTRIFLDLFPPGEETTILNWGGEHLPKFSGYFEAGAEWWGAALFTVYNRTQRRLTLALLSSTD